MKKIKFIWRNFYIITPDGNRFIPILLIAYGNGGVIIDLPFLSIEWNLEYQNEKKQ